MTGASLVTCDGDEYETAAFQHNLDLGEVCLAKPVHGPMVIRRSRRLVSRYDPEMYFLTLPTNGTMAVEWADHQAVHGRESFILHDSSLPTEIQANADSARTSFEGIVAAVPKSALPFPRSSVRRLVKRPLPARAGIGGLLAGTVATIYSDLSSYGQSDRSRLGTVVLGMVSGLIGHALEAQDGPGLAWRIRAFIERHLDNPALGPSEVAAAHHISLSYLHRLFQSEGDTVGSWIRRRRLELARRDLADPALRATPVHVIAARWGFTRAGDFSRAFRAAYGVPPRDFRV